MDVLLHRGLFIALTSIKFSFLLGNLTFCTCAMQFSEASWSCYYIIIDYYVSSFYLICKPTASALENAVNKVTLVLFTSAC